MRAERKRRRRRRLLIAAGVLAVLAIGLAIGGYVYVKDRTGSIYHPQARFVTQPTKRVPARTTETFSWPLYGYTQEHTRYFPASSRLHPPFFGLWSYDAGTLLEFPPVIYHERIFQLGDNAVLFALDKHNGHVLWLRHIGRLSASTPAVTSNTVYATVLETGNSKGAGEIVALNSANGAVRWRKFLASGTESSPLVSHGHVYFGDQGGTVYALDAGTGATQWTYQAGGAVKASPTLSGGILYFGDYGGHAQAISAQTGHRIWRSSSEGAVLGSGTFYSTAAVMYGRMFLGNTDGRIYAYDAATGNLDWAVQTGAYVYASPAVGSPPGLGPTIYLGSYDGTFYALNARTGAIRWSFNAHGKISGSATIIGDIVYFSDLGLHRIYGLGIQTGRVVYEKDTGAFDPAISDGTHLYLTGYATLYAYEPLSERESHTARASTSATSSALAPPSASALIASKAP